jgi:hypothetical protein
MTELNQMILTSFQAQCRYVENRIYDIKKKTDFNSYTHALIKQHVERKSSFFLRPSDAGGQMVLEIYLETTKNLTRRYVTGYTTDSPVEKL